MNFPSPGDRVVRAAAVAAAIGFAAIAAFRLALAAGAPWGHAAWGGAHAHLSTAQRDSSAAAVIWTAAALIVLGRARFWTTGKLTALVRWGTRFLAAASLLAAILNFASQSRWENLIFAPLAMLLAVLCTIVAGGRGRRDASPTTALHTSSRNCRSSVIRLVEDRDLRLRAREVEPDEADRLLRGLARRRLLGAPRCRLYETLGVWRDASGDEIEQRYRLLCERFADEQQLDPVELAARRATVEEAFDH